MESAQEGLGMRRRSKSRQDVRRDIDNELRQHAAESVDDDVDHWIDKHKNDSLRMVLQALRRDTAECLREAVELLHRLCLPQGVDISPELHQAAAEAFQKNIFYHPESATALIEPFNLSADFVQTTKLTVVREQLHARVGDCISDRERGIPSKKLNLDSFVQCCQKLGLSAEQLMEIAADEYQGRVLQDVLKPSSHFHGMWDPLLQEINELGDRATMPEALQAAKVRLVERLLADGRSEDAVQLILHTSMLSGDEKKVLEPRIREELTFIGGEPAPHTQRLTDFLRILLTTNFSRTTVQ